MTTDAELQALAEEIQHALSRGRADVAGAALARMKAALPAHPWVAAAERRIAVMSFAWPAVRAPAEARSRDAPSSDTIDLVAFHIDLTAPPSGVHEPIDYMAAATLSFEAAALRAPRARRLLITDEHTRVPGSLSAHEVVRLPLDASRPMYERMRAYAHHVATRAAGRATVLMDVDVVPTRDPAEIFATSFDIGLTWRMGFPEAPFNGGVIFAGPGAGAAKFFDEARRCYEELANDARILRHYPDVRAWWGDQFALAALVGHRTFGERTTDILDVNGARIALFPCSETNFTPDDGAAIPSPEPLFLHFKGNRKGALASYVAALRQGHGA